MKGIFRSILITALFVNVFVINSIAQINMPSPEVQSMLKFGKNDVSQYSGGVDIAVDIYNIESFVNIPIKLSYNGNHGILVRENASRVGLGWSLNPCCVVTKITKGHHDRSQYGFLQHHSYMNFDKPTGDPDCYVRDYDPDLQYYNTLKSSGSFYYDKSNNIIKIPLSNVDIKGNFDVSSGCFIITETDGNQYIYDTDETICNRMVTPIYDSKNWELPSSCYISRIISSNKKDTIDFEYVSGRESVYNYDNNGEPTYLDADKAILGYPKSYTVNGTKILSEIRWKYGVVKFLYKEGRKDLEGGRCLDEIIVQNKNGDIIRSCEFKYSYFTPNGVISYDAGSSYNYEDENHGSKLRLKLDKLILNGKAKNNSQVYSFDYEDKVFLPQRDSYSIDHWGYFNGEPNLTLNPELNKEPNGTVSSIVGANRSTNEQYAKACILKKITFPTGGSTEFIFESNTTNILNILSRKYLGKKCDNKLASTMQLITDYDPEDRFPTNGKFESDLPRTVKLDLSNLKLTGNKGWLKIYTRDYPQGIADAILIRFGAEEIGIQATPYSNALLYSISPGIYDVTISSKAKNLAEWNVCFEWVDEHIDCDKIGNVKVGGLRIAKIVNYSDGIVTSERRFDYSDPLGMSTGYLIQEPEYVYMYNNAYIPQSGDKPHTDILPSHDPNWHPNLFFSNNPIYPLRLTQNSVVGYGKVTEYDKGNGKIESFFLTAKEFPDYTNAVLRTPPYRLFENLTAYGNVPYFPIAEKQSNDFARGKIVKQCIFNEPAVNSYTLIKEVVNKYKCYNVRSFSTFSSTGVNYGLTITGDNLSDYKISSNDIPIGDKEALYYEIVNDSTSMFPNLKRSIKGQIICNKIGSTVQAVDYFISSGIVLNDSTIVKEYYDNGIVKNISIYSYNTEAQLTKLENVIGSDKKCIEYSYPSRSYLTELFNQNKVETPYLEIFKDNDRLVSAQFKEYKRYNNDENLFLLSKIKEGFSVNANKEVNYKDKITVDEYDSKGRILQVTPLNGIVKSYIWDDKSDLPIAVAENSVCNNVFFTSFEEECVDIDSCNCYTGRKSKKNGYSKLLQNLKPGVYLLSYWECVNNTWVYHESRQDVSNKFNISLTGLIDDVCFRPINAQITSYTHSPLVGVTSITDPKGITAYYEYDNLGRLINVKDSKRALRVNYDYKLRCEMYYLNPANQIVSFNEVGGNQSIAVSSNTSWSTSVSDSWISVTPSTIVGNSTLSISCTANTGAARTGFVTVQSMPSYSELKRTISVSQKSVTSRLSVGANCLSFGWLKESQEVSVNSRTAWSVSTKTGSFITAKKVSDNILRIECSSNMKACNRIGSITLSNGTQSVPISVTQGMDPSIEDGQ